MAPGENGAKKPPPKNKTNLHEKVLFCSLGSLL